MRSRHVIFVYALLLVLAGNLGAAENKAVPWDLVKLSAAPKFVYDAAQDKGDIKAIFYDGLPWHGKPTRVFAYLGLPKLEPGKKAPAMVLVHGGGGTAFDAWVRLWNSRGYAAIAMDTCGCVPLGKYGAWKRHDAGGPAGWGGFDQLDQPVEDQWTYHAVADAVLAHSLIRSRPQVDAEKTGITGISWGGYLTCITAGVDSRFQFAAPVYGCGFLGDNSVWRDAELRTLGPEKAAKWLKLWDPSVYLASAKMPMLWVTGTNDFAYPMDSLQKSYRLPKPPHTLCVRLRMPHGHGGAGENPKEIHAFAESILHRGAGLTPIEQTGRDGRIAWATFPVGSLVVKAELNYTKDTGRWQDRKWESVAVPVDAKTGKISAELPPGTTTYYFNLIDNQEQVTSSEHAELPR